MKKIPFYLLALVVLAALILGALKLRQHRRQALAAEAPPTPAPWAVHTAAVTRGRATRGFPSLALVKGNNEVAIAPRLDGTILEMGPREGQRVAAGKLLARIDTRELEDKLASLEAELQGAAADVERKTRDAQRAGKLLKDHAISEADADQLRTAENTAREQMHSLEKQIAAERTHLGYARVTAPFSGVISERLADPGDLALVGQPIYRLVATDAARLEVRLPAEVLEQVAPGTEVVVSHRGQSMTLHADRVFPSLDQRSLGRMESDVPELPFGVAPGALLRARVITAAVDDALLVPADALLPGSDSSRGQVLKLDGNDPPKVRAVPVSIRLRTADRIAVDGDLAPGDRVVTAHETTLLRLRDGDPVRSVEAGL